MRRMDMPRWPDQLSINAYTGAPSAPSALDSRAASWASQVELGRPRSIAAPPKPADPRDWKDPRVGWGVVVAENTELPPALEALIDARSTPEWRAPVLRYSAKPGMCGYLIRDGEPLPISTARRGALKDSIPKYLLVYGTPQEIPWHVQYHLNAVCSVGRLTLSGPALENYIAAALTDWKGCTSRSDSVVVWTVEHQPADVMTGLMRKAIAQPFFKRILDDVDLKSNSQLLMRGAADSPTVAALSRALETRRPGLVVTTSHGQTGPLDNKEQMTANLGLLVDTDLQLVQAQSVLERWQPDGAIWYAHACCSAGCDSPSMFDGIAAEGSQVDRILKSLAALGARTAAFPEALLGAKRPLRAFVGHVEPTFDLMLQHRFSGRYLTEPLLDALYNHLFQPEPLGLALRALYQQLGGIYTEYDEHLRLYNDDPNNAANVLYHAMFARDIQSVVVLGDPLAMLPALPATTDPGSLTPTKE